MAAMRGPLPARVPAVDECRRGRAGVHGRAHGRNNGCHGDAASPYTANACDGDPADGGHRKSRCAREAPQFVSAERSTGVRLGEGLENGPDSQVIDVAGAGVAYLDGGTAGEPDQAILHCIADRGRCGESVVAWPEMYAVAVVKQRCSPVVVENQEG